MTSGLERAGILYQGADPYGSHGAPGRFDDWIISGQKVLVC